ncbi:MAG: MBL fold metallo-hydrolase [Methanoregulaceae archaeon]|nr:MBL fold metallo-hydrolase [Methanoregulaceae archaeon]
MVRHSFIARVPDKPGALHAAAEIVGRHGGNINRLQYDRRIDPGTVFFEVTADEESYQAMLRELSSIGYLRATLKTPSFLKFYVYIPHQAGALDEFLNFTTSCSADIAFLDFDDKGRHPDRLTVSVSLDESAAADRLLDILKPRYRLEILEYDTTGRNLDNTVFYLRLAQRIRALVAKPEDEFLLRFLGDMNHIAQELMNLGKDPKEVFEKIIGTGETLRRTTGTGFFADMQSIPITGSTWLHCFQLPCGGNMFLVESPAEQLIIDTGFGIYHDDIRRMLISSRLWRPDRISHLIVTHADADHSGAGGCFDIPASLSRGTLECIRNANRAYGSRSQASILEEVYTTMINLFSRFEPPKNTLVFPQATGDFEGIFPVVSRFSACGLELEVLEGLGGHLSGQVYILCREHGLLFTADTVINFDGLSEERAEFSSIAVFLVTSVNVDSDLAKRERSALFELAAGINRELGEQGGRCLVCGGHGPVSVLSDGKLEPAGKVTTYHHRTVH